MNDIFTDMQSKIGCPYFFRPTLLQACGLVEMKRLCLSDYPKKTLEDFTCYVFGVPYAIILEALKREDVMKHGRTARD